MTAPDRLQAAARLRAELDAEKMPDRCAGDAVLRLMGVVALGLIVALVAAVIWKATA